MLLVVATHFTVRLALPELAPPQVGLHVPGLPVIQSWQWSMCVHACTLMGAVPAQPVVGVPLENWHCTVRVCLEFAPHGDGEHPPQLPVTQLLHMGVLHVCEVVQPPHGEKLPAVCPSVHLQVALRV